MPVSSVTTEPKAVSRKTGAEGSRGGQASRVG